MEGASLHQQAGDTHLALFCCLHMQLAQYFFGGGVSGYLPLVVVPSQVLFFHLFGKYLLETYIMPPETVLTR
jgi:hypothetical protein